MVFYRQRILYRTAYDASVGPMRSEPCLQNQPRKNTTATTAAMCGTPTRATPAAVPDAIRPLGTNPSTVGRSASPAGMNGTAARRTSPVLDADACPIPQDPGSVATNAITNGTRKRTRCPRNAQCAVLSVGTNRNCTSTPAMCADTSGTTAARNQRNVPNASRASGTSRGSASGASDADTDGRHVKERPRRT